jgi:hypothetical protein
VQPLLPGIREQHRTEHPVRLLFDQADKGLKDLLQRRAACDALEHATLAFEQGGAKAHAHGISRRLVKSTLISELSVDGSQANRFRAVCGVPVCGRMRRRSTDHQDLSPVAGRGISFPPRGRARFQLAGIRFPHTVLTCRITGGGLVAWVF